VDLEANQQKEALTIETAMLAEFAPPNAGDCSPKAASQFADVTAQRWRSWRGSGDEILGVGDAARRRRENLSWRLWWRAHQDHIRVCSRRQRANTVPKQHTEKREEVAAVLKSPTPIRRNGFVYVAVPEAKIDAVYRLLSES
jgi:hypothetical protein